MNIAKSIILFLFLFLFDCSYAQQAKQEVKIKGNAAEYSGLELSFYYERDFLTHEKVSVAKIAPNYDGKFEVSFKLHETKKLTVDLGAYTGILYAEPGKTYELVFPPRIDKTKEQEHNPYFVPQELYLGVTNQNKKDLNTLIANLEDSISSRVEPGLGILRQTANRIALEKILARMDTFFIENKNQYFNQYKEYRFHNLRYIVYLRDNERMLKRYFTKQPILLNVPTYTSLFEKLAKYGLTLKASKRKWTAHPTIEKELGLGSLRDSLNRFKYLQQKHFCDLYLVNGLHNLFYNRDFTQEKVLNLLDELRKDSDPSVIALSERVFKKLSHLRQGSLAPEIDLVNKDGEAIKLSAYSGKFIYLNFGTSWSVPFTKELELLKKLNDKRVKDLVIITVSLDFDFKKILKLKEENNYDWPFLHHDFNPKVAETYRVKVYPTYYLIGPDGSLVLSPAPSISESFLEIFFDIYQKWKREQYKIQQGIKN